MSGARSTGRGEGDSARKVMRGAAPVSAASDSQTLQQTRENVRKRREQIVEARRAKKEGPRTILGCIGIIAGLLIIMASIAFCAFSLLVGNILGGIRERDLSKPLNRIARYEEFFDQLTAQGYDVKKFNVSLLDSKQIYQWRAAPAGSDDARIFKWEYMLDKNEVVALTNGALALDVKLNYVTPGEAESWDFRAASEAWDPDDSVVRSIVESDVSLLSAGDVSSGWVDGPNLPSGPVGAPLVSPEEAKARISKMGGLPEEGEESAEGEEGAEAGEAVEVGAEGGAEGGEDDGSVEVEPGEEGEGEAEGDEGESPPEEGGSEGSGDGAGGGEDPDDHTDVW